MNCLSLNCLGVGNPSTVRELRNVTKQESPSLLFVMETKIRGVRVEDLKYTLRFSGCFVVDSDGLSGGVALFWTSDVEVEIKNYSISHNDARVKEGGKSCRFTGFYGEPRSEHRH